MATQTKLKTYKTKADVLSWLNNLSETQQAEAKLLLDVFQDVTQVKPKLWGDSIIGFGEYSYSRSNGDDLQFLATGFAIRKSGPTLYIMPGYNDYSKILKNLGPHKLGKSCVYLKSLKNIHLPTLKKLIRAGLLDLEKTYTVNMS